MIENRPVISVTVENRPPISDGREYTAKSLNGCALPVDSPLHGFEKMGVFQESKSPCFNAKRGVKSGENLHGNRRFLKASVRVCVPTFTWSDPAGEMRYNIKS